jgi:hypothetical protein
MLASIWGFVVPDRQSHGPKLVGLGVVAVTADVLCGEGGGHGACQLLVAVYPSPLDPSEATASFHFDMTSVRSADHVPAPTTPPPRYFF